MGSSTAEGEKFLIEAGAPYEGVGSVLRGLLLILAFGLPVIVTTAILGGYSDWPLIFLNQGMRMLPQCCIRAAEFWSPARELIF